MTKLPAATAPAAGPARATAKPARVELHIGQLAMPAGASFSAEHLAALIERRLQTALVPSRHDDPGAAPLDPALAALLIALEPQVLEALRSHGFVAGEQS